MKKEEECFAKHFSGVWSLEHPTAA